MNMYLSHGLGQLRGSSFLGEQQVEAVKQPLLDGGVLTGQPSQQNECPLKYRLQARVLLL